MAGATSLLTSRSDGLGPYVGIALVGHLAVLGALVAMSLLTPDAPPKPLFEPSIEVYAAEMPRLTKLPERATRAPAPHVEEPTPAPTVAPVTVPQSDMAIVDPKKPDPKPTGTTDDHRAADAQQRMKDLLDDIDVDAGPVDRDAGSPEGAADARGTENLGRGDPEFARYKDQVGRLFLENFRPLPTLAGKGFVTVILVRVDAGWNVVERKLKKSSGNAYWDRAALAAAELVTKIPPPPEKYREPFQTHGYEPTFGDP